MINTIGFNLRGKNLKEFMNIILKKNLLLDVRDKFIKYELNNSYDTMKKKNILILINKMKF